MTGMHVSTNARERAQTAAKPTALGLLGRDILPAVERLLGEFAVRGDLRADLALFLDGFEHQRPDLVLIDSDLMGYPCDVFKRVRERNPHAKAVFVACFWSEREAMFQDCADAVVHKPVRAAEWRRAFAVCGLPRSRHPVTTATERTD